MVHISQLTSTFNFQPEFSNHHYLCGASLLMMVNKGQKSKKHKQIKI